jgi:hypothetical protein
MKSEVGFRKIYAKGVWVLEIWPLRIFSVGNGRQSRYVDYLVTSSMEMQGFVIQKGDRDEERKKRSRKSHCSKEYGRSPMRVEEPAGMLYEVRERGWATVGVQASSI